MENLTANELIDINGGGDVSAVSMSVTSTTDSLLSLRFERTYGSQHHVTEISIGNNIQLGLSLLGLTSKS